MDETELFQRQIEAQGNLQRQAGDDSLKMYAPQLQEAMQQSQAVVIAEVNPKKIVDDMLLEFSGKEKQTNGNIIEVGEPMINKDGIRVMRLVMKSLINQSNTLSHLKNDEIRRILEMFSKNLAMDLALNWREYEIKDRTTCDAIMDTILINSFTVLKRAEQQNEKNWLGRISFESINNHAVKQEKKRGGLLEKFKL